MNIETTLTRLRVISDKLSDYSLDMSERDERYSLDILRAVDVLEKALDMINQAEYSREDRIRKQQKKR